MIFKSLLTEKAVWLRLLTGFELNGIYITGLELSSGSHPSFEERGFTVHYFYLTQAFVKYKVGLGFIPYTQTRLADVL